MNIGVLDLDMCPCLIISKGWETTHLSCLLSTWKEHSYSRPLHDGTCHLGSCIFVFNQVESGVLLKLMSPLLVGIERETNIFTKHRGPIPT